MLCDGRIVCGCADPVRPSRPRRRRARRRCTTCGPGRPSPRCAQDLNAGGSKFCGDCPLKLPLKKDETPPVRPLDAGPLPSRHVHRVHGGLQHLVHRGVLRAGNRHHPHASGRHARLRPVPPRRRRSRARRSSASTSSTTAKRSSTSARSRCASTSSRRFPHIYLYTSTNGLALPEAQARRLVHSGIDEVTFSIDGATPESYVKYRQRGRFDVAIANLRAMADEKRRSRPRPAVPQLALHPVHVERQRRGDGPRAASSPRDIGVDRLCWEMTDHPENAYSRRFVPGSPDLDAIRREIWDDNNLGNAIPGATPRARIDVRTLPLPGAAR